MNDFIENEEIEKSMKEMLKETVFEIYSESLERIKYDYI